MKKTVIVFGALIAALLILFQLSSYAITTNNLQVEYVIAVVAILFFSIGLVLRKRSVHVAESVQKRQIDSSKIAELGISKREYEVLTKISEGHSNKEIAELLFVSESTVKTHLSNVYSKLDARRRTQAIQRAKDLNIIH